MLGHEILLQQAYHGTLYSLSYILSCPIFSCIGVSTHHDNTSRGARLLDGDSCAFARRRILEAPRTWCPSLYMQR